MMGFAGMELDSVTGMNLAVYRAQDPGTGRWTSEDPLGFAAGDTNLYRYVANNPAAALDPSGLQGQKEAGDPPPRYVLPNPPVKTQPPVDIPGFKGKKYRPGQGGENRPGKENKGTVWYYWDEQCPSKGWQVAPEVPPKNFPRGKWRKNTSGHWIWLEPGHRMPSPVPPEPPPKRTPGNTYNPPPAPAPTPKPGPVAAP
jgi:RHS repeat-associated protein